MCVGILLAAIYHSSLSPEFWFWGKLADIKWKLAAWKHILKRKLTSTRDSWFQSVSTHTHVRIIAHTHEHTHTVSPSLDPVPWCQSRWLVNSPFSSWRRRNLADTNRRDTQNVCGGWIEWISFFLFLFPQVPLSMFCKHAS